MDRFFQMQVFTAVAEVGSFVGGARRLGISGPTVTRVVATLESELGVKLLNRTSRCVRVTDAGNRYLADARRILSDVTAADAAAVGVNVAARGHLTVTAGVNFGELFVMPHMADFFARFPDIEVSVLTLASASSLMDVDADASIHFGDLPDSSLRALHVGQVQQVLVASPQYLASHGPLRDPIDLQAHHLISASEVACTEEWRFTRDGSGCAVRVKPRLTVSSDDGAVVAARRHAGIVRAMRFQVEGLLQQGLLQTVLNDYQQQILPVNILHREGRHGSAKIRAFIDYFAKLFRENPALRAEASIQRCIPTGSTAANVGLGGVEAADVARRWEGAPG